MVWLIECWWWTKGRNCQRKLADRTNRLLELKVQVSCYLLYVFFCEPSCK
jgi:hypothetical protein